MLSSHDVDLILGNLNMEHVVEELGQNRPREPLSCMQVLVRIGRFSLIVINKAF